MTNPKQPNWLPPGFSLLGRPGECEDLADTGFERWKDSLDKVMPRGWDADAQPRAPLARWAHDDEILRPEWMWAKGDPTLLLGRHAGRLIGRRNDDRHVVTIAGNRAGKGRSLILPNLATWPGSVLVNDPKAELARMTARWRSQGLGQEVHVLDGFGISGWKSSSYNPLSELDPGSRTFIDDVGLIASALIIDLAKDPHWTDSAKSLIRGLILYQYAEGGECSLPRMRRLLLGAEGPLTPPRGRKFDPEHIFLRMSTSTAFDGHLSLIGKTFVDKNEQEMGSILSTAREQTAFLDSPAMAEVLKDSPLRLRSIKRKPTTVYLCLPASRLATHFRWLRVVVNLGLAALEEDPYRPPAPVLLLLEEFAVLGHMDAIEKAAGQIAGFGVKLWAVLQDLGQLKAIYKERWETFMGNAGISTWFGLNDQTSLEYVSNRLGDTHFSRMERVDLTMHQVGQGAAEYREALVNAKLLSPEEVGRIFARETGRLLVLHPGTRHLALQRLDASDPMFKGQIDDERS